MKPVQSWASLGGLSAVAKENGPKQRAEGFKLGCVVVFQGLQIPATRTSDQLESLSRLQQWFFSRHAGGAWGLARGHLAPSGLSWGERTVAALVLMEQVSGNTLLFQ